ncbi:tyrosinase family protein [Thalassobaculum sp.]|uniref:tyrosinase family protein n=1 Tax=Thalassobaculum sp. TaxID=2022740 RepID=UPI0032EE468D
MGCRKNIKRLTAAERSAFVNAFLALHTSGRLEHYRLIHSGANVHGHGGPAFTAWHREFVRRFEEDLQSVDPNVDLPYWDWTEDNLNAAGTESYIWRDDFLGGPGDNAGGGGPTGPNGGYPVTSGPFAGLFTRKPFSIFAFPGTGGTIATQMANPDYNVFRQMEGPHGSAHVFIGGEPQSFAQTARTPDFWMIHCNVDRLWAEWIDRHEGTPGFEPYKPAAGGPTGHNLNDNMWPWNGGNVPFSVPPYTNSPEMVSPADLIDHRALGYDYDTLDPTCIRVVKPVVKDIRDGGGKIRLPKELKERAPKELKERLPKELKERTPKEFKEIGPKELKERAPKEFKELGPKENKDIRENPKDLREVPDFDRPFIRPELRPDLRASALGFEPDALEVDALRRRLIDR